MFHNIHKIFVDSEYILSALLSLYTIWVEYLVHIFDQACAACAVVSHSYGITIAYDKAINGLADKFPCAMLAAMIDALLIFSNLAGRKIDNAIFGISELHHPFIADIKPSNLSRSGFIPEGHDL
jgi:hypothetical protein